VVTAERDGRDGVLRVAANGGEEVEGDTGDTEVKGKGKKSGSNCFPQRACSLHVR
jgi:hypothetical protein